MKKLVLILMVFVYLFTSTEFSEMLKLPFLFNHYTEHQAENQRLTFGQFLYAHYVDHSHELNEGKGKYDQDEDSQLPFHSHTNFTSSTSYFFQIPTIKIVTEPIIFEAEEGKIFFDNQSLRSFYFPSIWQPPKIA